MPRDECRHCGDFYPHGETLTYGVCKRCIDQWEKRRDAAGLPPLAKTEGELEVE